MKGHQTRYIVRYLTKSGTVAKCIVFIPDTITPVAASQYIADLTNRDVTEVDATRSWYKGEFDGVMSKLNNLLSAM